MIFLSEGRGVVPTTPVSGVTVVRKSDLNVTSIKILALNIHNYKINPNDHHFFRFHGLMIIS